MKGGSQVNWQRDKVEVEMEKREAIDIEATPSDIWKQKKREK
jgi:hypothetical protein